MIPQAETALKALEQQRFMTHIEDLRLAVLRSLAGFAVAALLAFLLVTPILRWISGPYLDYAKKTGGTSLLISLSPTDTFQTTLYSAILFGAALASPWILYQIARFISPGLYAREKKYFRIFSLAIFFCFASGVSFAYFVVLPTAISFFYSYSTSVGITPSWTLPSYFDFVTTFLACFGIVFELPVAILALTALGIVSPRALRHYRRHAIVVIFIIAAIFTPPDIVSQVSMGIPMVLLYEISVLAAVVVVRKHVKRAP